MELLGDVGLMDYRFVPFRGAVSVDVRYVHGLRLTYHRLKYRFGRTRWNS